MVTDVLLTSLECIVSLFCSDRSSFQKFVRSWPYSWSSLNLCLLSSIIIPFRLDSSFLCESLEKRCSLLSP
jgi:hypothetical protein